MANKRETFRGASEYLPAKRTIAILTKAAAVCHGCDLWKRASQTVFGEGSSTASILLIGEQPGDKEDLAGHPFVGPAGRVLDEALAIAGIPRSEVYVTNAVKHFNWSPAERGKRRIHKKPRYSEIQACRPWLDAEIDAVKPKIVICLGATAAQALLGRAFSVMRQRGTFVSSSITPRVMATVHPSSILRAPDEAARHQQKQAFIDDLRVAAKEIHRLPKAA